MRALSNSRILELSNRQKYCLRRCLDFQDLDPHDFGLNEFSTTPTVRIFANPKLVFPKKSSFPEPNEDAPGEIKQIYNEARDVFPYSVCASAVLLRLALEQLMKMARLIAFYMTKLKKLQIVLR